MSVGIIGAGVSGMAMGLQLQADGRDFTIFEKGSEVGGTWRDNRYPGLNIDVPSPLYTFRAHRHPGWTRWMPGGPEILDYHARVATETGLRDRIRLHSEVTAATWTGHEWEVVVNGTDTHRFGALVCASGFLHHPRWPDIGGLDSFAGDVVHSARWDDRVVTQGRRVGVIGSGSTGVQLVSALGGQAAQLTHFARTPQWIFPSLNFPIPAPARALLGRRPQTIDVLADGIEWFADWLLGGATARPGVKRTLMQLAVKAHLRRVRDPELRARLTPQEQPLCKRPVLSTRYYGAVQRADVATVTTAIDHIEPRGVVTADGVLHELDVLICATGFRAHDYMRPIAITGADGLTLDEAWAGGPYGYRTVGLPGFPNLFMVLGPHSPLVSISIHASAELQSQYVAQLLDVIDRPDVVSVQPTAEATARWLQLIRDGMPGTVWASGCDSWYLGDGETPVLWPYRRAAWRELLGTPVLGDYDVATVPVAGAAA